MPRPPKKRRSLYPEPGTWVTDDLQGLPKIEPPEPLPKGKLSLDIIREHVGYNGLGFCIFVLISSDRIKDKRLAKRWIEAKIAMIRVIECLEAAPEVQSLEGGENVTDDTFDI